MENTKTTVTETKTAITVANGAENILCVETKLGTLVAYPSKDPAHPGIYIDLKRDGIPYSAAIALIEYTDDDVDPETGEDLLAEIVSRTWGNAMADEYMNKVSVKNIEEFFTLEDQAMIDLYTALQLAGISDEEYVYLQNKAFPDGHEILTGRMIKEKYDLRKVKVSHILPWFSYRDYAGWELQIMLPRQPGQK